MRGRVHWCGSDERGALKGCRMIYEENRPDKASVGVVGRHTITLSHSRGCCRGRHRRQSVKILMTGYDVVLRHRGA